MVYQVTVFSIDNYFVSFITPSSLYQVKTFFSFHNDYLSKPRKKKKISTMTVDKGFFQNQVGEISFKPLGDSS